MLFWSGNKFLVLSLRLSEVLVLIFNGFCNSKFAPKFRQSLVKSERAEMYNDMYNRKLNDQIATDGIYAKKILRISEKGDKKSKNIFSWTSLLNGRSNYARN